ncbi:MAG: leucine-rich repeat protein [Ignavibacteria bacterium]|nr:leucine-rich repeat protein [Ignavibacteria bacterium]
MKIIIALVAIAVVGTTGAFAGDIVSVASMAELAAMKVYEPDKFQNMEALEVGGEVSAADWSAFRNLRIDINCKALKHISFPDATYIGHNSFNNCRIETVSFPNVTLIESGAFFGSALTEASFPKVTYIGSMAFSGCQKLTTASFPMANVIERDAFNVCNSLASIDFPNVTYIANRAFYGCSSLTSVSFPYAEIIGGSVFAYCFKLADIYFPNVTNINDSSFYDCDGLKSISFPSATNIGQRSFASCDSLLEVDLPKITIIPDKAFVLCIGLKSVSFPNVTNIGELAFYKCHNLADVSIPNATKIGEQAFDSCKIESVSFPNITNIGKWAFYRCIELTSVSLPNALNIDNEAFLNCKSLASVSFPNATRIDFTAFKGCNALKNIDAPKFTSDGQIEHIQQGNTGDCWLLAALYSLSKTEVGQAAIKNAIKKEGNNIYSVVLYNPENGAPWRSSDITLYDIFNADTLSTSDIDTRILEIAFEQYIYKFIKKDKKQKQGLHGGASTTALYALTKKVSFLCPYRYPAVISDDFRSFKNIPPNKLRDSLEKLALSPDKYFCVVSFSKKNKNSKEIEFFELCGNKFYANHGYCVLGFTGDMLTLTEPSDTSKRYYIPLNGLFTISKKGKVTIHHRFEFEFIGL